MHTWAFLSGVVERLQNTINSLLIQLPVKLRKPHIKAYQQRAFYPVDGKICKPITRRVMVQVSPDAESLIVAVNDFTLRIYQIQAVMRLVRLGQSVGTAQHNPKL
jgi:hypothetical protein